MISYLVKLKKKTKPKHTFEQHIQSLKVVRNIKTMKCLSFGRIFFNELKTITVEPVIFLFILGIFTLNGAQIPTNILIYKICRFERNLTQEICDNLGEEANQKIEEEVS